MRIGRELQTERLILRDYNQSDAEGFTKLGISFYSKGKLDTKDKASDYFNEVSESSHEFALGIFLKESGELIGSIELSHMDWFDSKAGEISYHIRDDSWGKGFATESAGALLSYCFNFMNLHKVYADTEPSNAASQRVLEKLGFKLEGTIRERREVNGKWVDELDFGLLKSELNEENS